MHRKLPVRDTFIDERKIVLFYDSLRVFTDEPIGRDRQAVMIAQRCARIFRAEQPSALQLRDDEIDEVIEPPRS
ncbi:hypothetical protein PACILC2_32040 [Paenibacillus cisolokensis]|uniref:Uncharacterized protein n=1 Tax=Paenibacillus cisolokensis TaxID=1658519 RepID=A0ABQ4N9P6_9BACL|nr:hypothetical protein PACILC2_32040 [Paenibacillus cisolokensis]